MNNIKYRNEEEWKIKLQEENMKIFKDYNINLLSSREKRKIIFDYLVNNSTYNYELLSIIRNRSGFRNPMLELGEYSDTKHSVCNAIAEYYKLLLSYNDIYSICVVCVQESNDMPSGKHMLNLVYDEETGNYSFDDVTMTIIERDFISKKYGNLDYFESNKYFNYDLKTAHQYGQGNEKPYAFAVDNYYLFTFGAFFSFYEKKALEEYHKYGIENPINPSSGGMIPKNIVSFDENIVNRK